MPADDPHRDTPVLFGGEPFGTAKAAVIMVHGRGSGAEEILTLAAELPGEAFIFAAPQANNNTWYPYSFLYPIEQNEPGVSSGLKKIECLVTELNEKGIHKEKIMLLGFSQGACLTLEFAARNAARYGGIIGLSGGLIGEKLNAGKYSGDLDGTPVFLGCSDKDPHIPLERVADSAEIFLRLNGRVEKRIYRNMSHTITKDEIDYISELMISISK